MNGFEFYKARKPKRRGKRREPLAQR